MATISKTSTFEVPKFSQSFSPLPFRWARPAGLGIWGRGSRGETPLHAAAENGQELVVQRLIEAKAAVDAKTNEGRGLGRRILGRENLLEAMGSLREEVDEMLMVEVFSGQMHSLSLQSVPKCLH